MRNKILYSPDTLVKRLEKRLAAASPDSKTMKQALTRIGLIVTAETILNIRRADLIDTGRLINSIRYEMFKDDSQVGISIGSFGVPYAAVQEYGFNGSVQVPSHQRTIKRGRGKNIKATSFAVRAHGRKINIAPKYFLRNAVRQHRDYIIDTIRAALRG